MIEDLIGTKAVFFIDEKMNILGKVPLSELRINIKRHKRNICSSC
jgi:hypothetical protein